MPHPRGKLTLDALAGLVAEGEIDTVVVAFPDLYGRLMGKRFDAEFFLEAAARTGTHACDYLLTVDMEMNPVPGYAFANWERGYGDVHLVPDLDTLRPAPWHWTSNSAIVLADVVSTETHEPVPVAPRNLLKAQLARAAEAGFAVMAASELEYYLYETPYREFAERGFAALRPAGWYLEDYHVFQGSRTETFHFAARRDLRDAGIPVESTKGEWGRGQHELNLRYTEALEMADRHVLMKEALKEIADQQEMSVTFMAKPAGGQAGSSSHVHMSLWTGGQNAFAGERSIGRAQVSETFLHFLGGLIRYAPDWMVFYAPTVNSYKRYEDASWAPTRLAWSYDNRTAGFRVVGAGGSLRVENRIPGADVNPYLAYTAMLASGLAGIKEKLEPPPIFEGDVYAAAELPRVPYSLREAADLFEASELARRVLGEEVHRHYLHFFRTEWKAYEQAVTDWDRKRYFERI
ncbi:L-glutamine synthetase [Oceanithermus profundus DSM 14977]|uniref:L-glutamine synthetase n=1 Tax=Oceanithermus profundus (strain DSM 14977 / NBRC 100410 / VKM B-2274 / 506) TaxID=670487 RepID=E4UA50_OCEP5|nr:glutamine synthetase family protein [Oceanithermus profundus]ADR37427.1 L-glutamine synthetase [Oceanithermus profundus DSM 14977]